MYLKAPTLQGNSINNYSMYMNKNNQAGSLQEPANSLAQINKEPGVLNLEKSNETTQCQTCKSRKYVDVSNDSGVSFQSPTSVAPGASFSKVSSHEQEHVSREQAKASRNDRRVVSQSVQIYIDTCPECGRAYSAGGKTTTVTKGESQKPDYFKEKMNKFMSGHFGAKVDTYI